MADDSYAPASASTTTLNTTGRTSYFSDNATPSIAVRRAATIGPNASLRQGSTQDASSPPATDGFAETRRRSSTYSDYSLADARRELETSADELFNPSKPDSKTLKKSPFVYVPLTLALLPAAAGILFENGSAFFTDLILLSLAAVFLHWSVTQPWDWYQSAQQIRIVKDEIMTESVFDSETEPEPSPTTSTITALENISEDAGKQKETGSRPSEPSVCGDKPRDARQATALKELYLHEIVALTWCFIFPALGAYLLHAIRGQLTRPSEGLVSDYNLTIFLCAAEVRPVSHLIRMIQSRTLRLQQIVACNPHDKKSISTEQLNALSTRLDELEARYTSNDKVSPGGTMTTRPNMAATRGVDAAVAREIRNTVQPELEALNRAMRRYEKKLTVLASSTDNRIEYVDYRLNDAIALAAVAAKNSNSQWTLTTWLFEKVIVTVAFPFQAVLAVFTFPFRTVSALFSRKKRGPPERGARYSRNGKMPAQARGGSDRVPTRVFRK
ncbi:hypothetical protein F4778DRAFT_634117 [Xylariomycetidae sp. FL2044]|nr:hypothetical protein F4778DRAFT_634117 [Xylariomycetidae sp. FL2044]